MARTKVRLEETKKLIKQISPQVSRVVSNLAANKILEMMKDRISKGISPIEGKPRFPRYINPKNYPAKARKNFPNKRNRPVNLFLSGRFLSELTARVSPAQGRITIGFWSEYGKTLEDGHRNGANGQPSRPIIPEENERFARSIRLSIIKLYEQAVLAYLRRR